MKRIVILAAAALASVLGAVPAFAQFNQPAPPPGHGFIDVGALFGFLAPYLDALLQAMVPIAISWAAYKLHQMTGANIDKALSDRMARVLQNEASSLVADGQVKFSGAKVEVNSAIVWNAANAVIARMPEAQRIGFTPELVAARIVDYVPQVPAAAAIMAEQHKAAQG